MTSASTVATTPTTTMDDLHAASIIARRNRAAVRAALRSGTLTLQDAMTSPPPELLRDPLIDVLRHGRGCCRRSPAWMEKLGREAVRDGVNLMVPLGRASARSRAWVAEHGSHRWTPGVA